MPELAGRVADAFESHVREHEERWLSPGAVRSYESRGRNLPEEECRDLVAAMSEEWNANRSVYSMTVAFGRKLQSSGA